MSGALSGWVRVAARVERIPERRSHKDGVPETYRLHTISDVEASP